MLEDLTVRLLQQQKTKLVLHGVSGSGKTSAVKWFTQQDAIRRYFVGGLYYFPVPNPTVRFDNSKTLSQDEESYLVQILSRVFRTLSFESNAGSFDAKSWQDGLRLLDLLVAKLTKPMLLVIDNVAIPDVVDALNISGVTCLFLTNTPIVLKSRLQSESVYEVYKLPLLDDSRCRELFLMKYEFARINLAAIRGSTTNSETEIESIIGACQGRLKDIALFASLLASKEKIDLKAFLLRRRSPLDDMEFYLNQLDARVQEIYKRFIVFPLNHQIQRSLVVKFFSKTLPGNDFRFLDELCFMELLDSSSFDQTLSLHESLYHALRESTQESEYQRYHFEIVEFYHSECGGEWWRTVNDGYFYRHIQHHMRMVKQLLPESKIKIDGAFLRLCNDFATDVGNMDFGYFQFLISSCARDRSNLSYESYLDLTCYVNRCRISPSWCHLLSRLFQFLAVLVLEHGVPMDSLINLQNAFASLRKYRDVRMWKDKLYILGIEGENRVDWTDNQMRCCSHFLIFLFPPSSLEFEIAWRLEDENDRYPRTPYLLDTAPRSFEFKRGTIY